VGIAYQPDVSIIRQAVPLRTKTSVSQQYVQIPTTDRTGWIGSNTVRLRIADSITFLVPMLCLGT